MLHEEGEVAGGVLLVPIGVDSELPGGRLAADHDGELVLNCNSTLELVKTLNKPAEMFVLYKKQIAQSKAA